MKKHLAIAFILALSFGNACSNLEEKGLSDTILDTYFQTEEDYIASMAPMYETLRSLGSHGGYFTLQEVSSDELALPQRGTDWGYTEWYDVHRHDMKPWAPGVANAWSFLYTGVLNCNRIIYQFEYALKKGYADASMVEKYSAEARAVRALYYYYLLDSFGNVPILTDYLDDTHTPFTKNRQEVFAFVEQELNAVLTLLPKRHDQSTYGRMNYYAARALQAKLYLNAEVYTGTPRWQDCLNACQELVDAGIFQLEANYRDNFAANNQHSHENIMVVVFDSNFAKGFNLAQATLHYESQKTYLLQEQPWNGYCSLQEFYNLHEDADIRKQNFLEGPQFAFDGSSLLDPNAEANDPDGPQINFTPEIGTIGEGAIRQEGVRVGKYEFEIGAAPDLSNDMPLFRYADILLTLAEAKWRLNPNDADALALVNQVRNRAFEPDSPLTELNAQNFLSERGRELFYEGVRRQDLIRFGVYGNPTQFMPGSDPCRELWPIPQSQLVGGANIVQNPCY